MDYFSPPGSAVKWSRISHGCWQIGPSEGWGKGPPPKQAEAAVRAALDAGITVFDTAEGYGDGESERRLGRALGTRKYDVAVISKIWPDVDFTETAFHARLDQSLRCLERDYVDLYLFHFPNNRLNTEKDNARFFDLMSGLQQSGKARLVGLSNFEAADLGRLGPRCNLFVFDEVPYNLLEREYEGENLRAHQRYRIRYLAYSPLAQGLLTGRFDKDSKITDRVRGRNELYSEPKFSWALRVVEVLRQIASETRATVTQVALAWTLRQPNIELAIVGSSKPEQLMEAAKATDVQLSQAQLLRITAASNAFARLQTEGEAASAF